MATTHGARVGVCQPLADDFGHHAEPVDIFCVRVDVRRVRPLEGLDFASQNAVLDLSARRAEHAMPVAIGGTGLDIRLRVKYAGFFQNPLLVAIHFNLQLVPVLLHGNVEGIGHVNFPALQIPFQKQRHVRQTVRADASPRIEGVAQRVAFGRTNAGIGIVGSVAIELVVAHRAKHQYGTLYVGCVGLRFYRRDIAMAIVT